MWFMRGASYVGYTRVLSATGADWAIAQVADFNADGKTDILWRNQSTGENIVWFMNGAVYANYARIDAVGDTNWHVGGR